MLRRDWNAANHCGRHPLPADPDELRVQVTGVVAKPVLFRAMGCIALLLGVLAGCGASGSFRDGVYSDDIVRYRIGAVPSGWQRASVDDNDVAFHHRELGTVSINSTCTEYEDVPEQALLGHLLFGTRERVFRTEETVSLDGRGALHAIVDLELDGVPLTVEAYVLRKDGCVYDLTYIASRAAYSRGRAAFETVVRGFHVLRTDLPD